MVGVVNMKIPSKHDTCYDVYCYGDIGRNGFDETVIDNVADSFTLSPDYKKVYIIPDSSKEQEFLHDIDMEKSYGLPTYDAWVYEGNEDRKTLGRKYIQMYPYNVPILKKGDYVCWDFHLRGEKSTWLVTAMDSQAIYEQVGSIQMCTNELRFYNEYGKLIKIPCVLGDDINSEKNISLANMKYINGIVTIYVQLNEDSHQIHPNQRFLFGRPGNWTAFRVVSVGVNNFMNEVFFDNDSANLLEITVEASYVNKMTDDLVLGIADVNKFSIQVETEDIYNIVGTNVSVSATIYKNGEEFSSPIIWSSTDENIATVTSDGTVLLVGEGTASIIATMEKNPELSKEISVTAVSAETPITPSTQVVITPNSDGDYGVLQGDTQEFSCYLYKNGEKKQSIFDFTLETEVPKTDFVFKVLDENHFSVKNIRMNNRRKLKVVCKEENEGVTQEIDIKLKGAW